MNRKQKRGFNKLSEDEKSELIKSEIVNKVSPIMSREIANATVNGIYIERDRLYNHYVKPIDESDTEEEKTRLVNELLGFLREEHVKKIQREGKGELV